MEILSSPAQSHTHEQVVKHKTLHCQASQEPCTAVSVGTGAEGLLAACVWGAGLMGDGRYCWGMEWQVGRGVAGRVGGVGLARRRWGCMQGGEGGVQTFI